MDIIRVYKITVDSTTAYLASSTAINATKGLVNLTGKNLKETKTNGTVSWAAIGANNTPAYDAVYVDGYYKVTYTDVATAAVNGASVGKYVFNAGTFSSAVVKSVTATTFTNDAAVTVIGSHT